MVAPEVLGYSQPTLSAAGPRQITGLVNRTRRIGHGFRTLNSYRSGCCCLGRHEQASPPTAHISAHHP